MVNAEVATVFHINKGSSEEEEEVDEESKLLRRLLKYFRSLKLESRVERNDLRSLSRLGISTEGRERSLQRSILVIEHLPVASKEVDLVNNRDHLQTNRSESPADGFFVFSALSKVRDSSMSLAEYQTDKLIGNGAVID